MRNPITAVVCAAALTACGNSSNTGSDGGDSGVVVDSGVLDAGPDSFCPFYDAGYITATEANAGYALVQQFGCQKCHGAVLSGNNDGVTDPLSGNIEYPPNLTPDQGTGLGCWSDQQVMEAILNNVDNQGNPICQPMPNFADAGMTIEDATAIIEYLRTLTPFINNVPSGPSCCLFDLDCGDNGYCSQRECVDGGAPEETTSGTMGTTGETFGTNGHSSGRTSSGSSSGSTTGTPATSSSGTGTTTAVGTTGAATTAGTSGVTTGGSVGTTGGSTGGTSAGTTAAATTAGSIGTTGGSMGTTGSTTGGATTAGATSAGTTGN